MMTGSNELGRGRGIDYLPGARGFLRQCFLQRWLSHPVASDIYNSLIRNVFLRLSISIQTIIKESETSIFKGLIRVGTLHVFSLLIYTATS